MESLFRKEGEGLLQVLESTEDVNLFRTAELEALSSMLEEQFIEETQLMASPLMAIDRQLIAGICDKPTLGLAMMKLKEALTELPSKCPVGKRSWWESLLSGKLMKWIISREHDVQDGQLIVDGIPWLRVSVSDPVFVRIPIACSAAEGAKKIESSSPSAKPQLDGTKEADQVSQPPKAARSSLSPTRTTADKVDSDPSDAQPTKVPINNLIKAPKPQPQFEENISETVAPVPKRDQHHFSVATDSTIIDDKSELAGQLHSNPAAAETASRVTQMSNAGQGKAVTSSRTEASLLWRLFEENNHKQTPNPTISSCLLGTYCNPNS